MVCSSGPIGMNGGYISSGTTGMGGSGANIISGSGASAMGSSGTSTGMTTVVTSTNGGAVSSGTGVGFYLTMGGQRFRL